MPRKKNIRENANGFQHSNHEVLGEKAKYFVSRLVFHNLTEKYLTEPFQRDNPLRGPCYIATQAICYLMDTERLDS